MFFDPDAYAVRSQIIAITGDLSAIAPDFYGAAAAFHVFGAEVMLITGLPVDLAYAVFPFLVGLVFVLFAAILSRRLTSDSDAPIIAASVAAVGASSLFFGMAPTPLAVAAIYLTGSVVILMTNINRQLDLQYILPLGLFLLAGAVTHKIPVMLFAGIGAVLVGYSAVLHWIGIHRSPGTMWIVAALGIAALALQWIYLLGYSERAVLKIFSIVGLSELPISFEVVQPAAATVVESPLIVSLLRQLYLPATVGAGGIVGLVLFRRYDDSRVRLLQAAAGVTVSAALLGLVGSGLGYQRVYMYGAVFVATLIGVGLARLLHSGRVSTRTVAAGFLLVILLANPLSSTAMPDYPDTPRLYLSAEEVEGKQFANHRIDQTGYMDLYYGDEAVDFKQAARGGIHHQKTVPNPLWHPGLLNNELINGTLLNYEYQYIAYRTDVEVWRLRGNWYRLRWEPEQTLNANTSYQRVYDNGGVTIHARK
ncbi:hypothetical protein BV210_05815 [Halorientalis sp. IM1011]|nr:hypothetical protein BV210_05815 [Halorientalis sp. IM1011]